MNETANTWLVQLPGNGVLGVFKTSTESRKALALPDRLDMTDVRDLDEDALREAIHHLRSRPSDRLGPYPQFQGWILCGFDSTDLLVLCCPCAIREFDGLSEFRDEGDPRRREVWMCPGEDARCVYGWCHDCVSAANRSLICPKHGPCEIVDAK